MNINYRHLYHFWAVAKEGHLTRAAARLHLSQSAVSMQIRELEGRLGHELFTREGRSLRLTETGRVVLSYAESIFSLGNEMLAAVSAGAGGGKQRIRIGAVATLSRNFQDNFLRPLLGMNDVHLQIESGSLEELVKRLCVHKLEVVLSNRAATSHPDQPLHVRRVSRQRVCLIGPPRRDGAEFRFPDDLSAVRLLLPGHSSDIRTQFDVLCEEHGLKTNVFGEVDDMAMLRLLARDAGCVAVLPPVVVQDELGTGLLEEYCVLPQVHENFYAITPERQFEPFLLARLLDKDLGRRMS